MTEFRMNPGLLAALGSAPAMEAALLARVEVAADLARALAPVGESDDPHPGQFRDSIRGEVTVENGIAVGRLLTTDPEGNIIEFGSSKTPAHATLRRAVEATVGPVVGGHGD